MKPLVVIPIVKGVIHQQAMDAALSLQWPEQLDYLMLEGGDDPETPVDNITAKYNFARDVVLANGYDALLTLESDIIPPPDALMKLAAIEADVAYGLYCWRASWPYWNAYTMLQERTARSLSKDLEQAKEAWGNVIEVAGVGNGCTLIHRNVLEALPFRKAVYMNYCCDWTLALDCQEHGFVQKNDLSVICGHMEQEPIPRVLWPDITKHGLYRATDIGPMPKDLVTNALTYLRNVEGIMKLRILSRAHVGAGRVVYPGEVVELPMETGKQLVWHGIAEEILEGEPEEKPKKKSKKKEAEEDEPPGWTAKEPCPGCPERRR